LEGQLRSGRHIGGRYGDGGLGGRDKSRIVVPGDGDVRKGFRICSHVSDGERILEDVALLDIGADGAREGEKDDREGDQEAEHHAEGIEELGI
jgi:hypothetical protein